MAYRFVFSNKFDRQIKALAKRNPQLRSDLAVFLKDFDADRHPVIPGGGGARKARMKVSGRGKSGGYRVIYFVHVEDRVWLLNVYDKVRSENLPPAHLRDIVALIQWIKEDDDKKRE